MGGTGNTFHGATVLTLDAKGRLAIPTRHRDALLAASKTLVLSAHPDGCALLYPESAWERVRSQVEKFPSFHPQASWWKRLLLGFEEHIAPDASGRVLVSSGLRLHAKLAQAGAGIVIGQRAGITAGNIFDFDDIDQEIGQLISAPGQTFD